MRYLILLLLLFVACSESANIKIPYVKAPVDMAFVCFEHGNPVPYKDCNQAGRTLYGFVIGGNEAELGVINLSNGARQDFDPEVPGHTPMYLDAPAGSLKRILSSDDSAFVYILDYTQAILFRVATRDFKTDSMPLPCQALDMTLGQDELFMTCPKQNSILKLQLKDFGKDKAITLLDAKQPDKIAVCGDKLFVTHLNAYNLTVMGSDGGNMQEIGVFPACSDGIDNDGDGLIDARDPGCTGPDGTDESGDVSVDHGMTFVDPPQCSNGLDDNGNGLTDLDDPACYGALDISEGNPPVHRIKALVPDRDCKNLYLLTSNPGQVMVMDIATGKVQDLNKDENTNLLHLLGIKGALLQANPVAAGISTKDKDSFLWVSLANGKVVKFQISDKDGPVNRLKDSEIGVRDSITQPQLMVYDKPVDGGFIEHADYPSLGPIEVSIVPDSKDVYSFYGVVFNKPKLLIPNEEWSVTYEGKIPGAISDSGVIYVDGHIKDQGVDYCNLGVEKGDTVTFTALPEGCDLQEMKITAVWPHELGVKLPEHGISPDCTGIGVSYYIHATGQWVVKGSESGFLHPWYSDGDSCAIKKDADGLNGRAQLSKPKPGIELTSCPVYPNAPEVAWKPFRNAEFTFSIYPGCTIDKEYHVHALDPEPGTTIRFTALNYLVPITANVGGRVVKVISPPGSKVVYLINRGKDLVEQVSADTGEVEQSYY